MGAVVNQIISKLLVISLRVVVALGSSWAQPLRRHVILLLGPRSVVALGHLRDGSADSRQRLYSCGTALWWKWHTFVLVVHLLYHFLKMSSLIANHACAKCFWHLSSQQKIIAFCRGVGSANVGTSNLLKFFSCHVQILILHVKRTSLSIW